MDRGFFLESSMGMCWKYDEAKKKVGAGEKQTRVSLSERSSVGDWNI